MTRAGLLLSALAVLIAVAPAQDRDKGVLRGLSTPRFIQLDVGLGMLYIVGDVEVELDGRYLRCDNLVAWLDVARKRAPGEPAPTAQEQASQYVKEVYAEGNVIYSREGEWIHGDRLFLDLQHERGLVIDATMAIPLTTRDGQVPLVLRAEELRILGRGRVQGSGVQTWASPFGRPFTNVTSDTLEIFAEGSPLLGSDQLYPELPENYHVATQGNVMRLGTFPVMWFPDFAVDTASYQNALLIQSVRLHNSSEFGREVGLSLGTDITHGEDRRRWGSWRTHFDWYSRRGAGAGVDLVYATPTYRGELITRYQRDKGRDRFFGPPPTNNRGRLSWWHRQLLPAGVQMDVEFQLFSDRGYLPTWFEDDDKQLKPPENLIYLKKVFFNSMVSGLYSTRINDWFTRVEHQPELRYDLVTEPLFDLGPHPLYLTVTARGGHGRIEYDDDLNLDSPDTWRSDVDALLEYAMPVGPFKVTPFAGVRYSYFERDLFNDKNKDRVGLTFGGTLNLQAWKGFEAHGGLFDLDGLRHVMIPEITFRNTVGVDTPPESLIPLDDIETFDNLQAFELRLRNLLQTVRHRAHGTEVDTFIDLELEVPYFPNPRDNRGEVWGNLDVDMLIKFSDALQLITDFEVDWYGHDIEVGNVAVGYTPSRDFQTFAGFRHFHDEYDAVFAQANWRVDEKWMLTVESSYDFLRSRGIDHRFGVSHIGAEWVFELGLKADVGEDDFSVFISFEPRMFFAPAPRSRHIRSEPRLHYLGTGFGK